MAGHDCLHCSTQHTPCCAECECHDPLFDGPDCTCRPACDSGTGATRA